MFFSQFSKLAFTLFLIATISCQQPTTANNTTNTANNNTNSSSGNNTTTNSSTPTPTSTPAEQNSSQSPKHTIIPYPSPTPGASPSSNPSPSPTPVPKLTLPMGPSTDPPATYIPSPQERPKNQQVQQTLVDLNNDSRALVKYYKFLTQIKGFNLNLPKEMPGGPSLFKADDVIQFTFKEPQAAVLIARYTSSEKMSFGIDAMRRFNVDGRRALQARNYALLVKWGDERVFKALTDSIEQFENIKQ